MRLIDADEMKKKAETVIETTDAFQWLIDEQPTIDAIPVEWLYRYTDAGAAERLVVHRILNEWQKEQEAR